MLDELEQADNHLTRAHKRLGDDVRLSIYVSSLGWSRM